MEPQHTLFRNAMVWQWKCASLDAIVFVVSAEGVRIVKIALVSLRSIRAILTILTPF